MPSCGPTNRLEQLQYNPLITLFKFGELAITNQVFGGDPINGPRLDWVNAFFEVQPTLKSGLVLHLMISVTQGGTSALR